MTFEELKEKAHCLPLQPGVYIMQDANHQVIYVGKAKALKNRVSSYFTNSAAQTEKTRAMVAQIDHFDVILADSEFEALLLENSLIKRHQPHYNILLKDDKGYPYICVDRQADYPVFQLSNRVEPDGKSYFGPYGSRRETQSILDALRAAFRLPSCRKKFPRDIGKERPCLNYHMKLCDGYCRPEMDQPRYREAVEQAIRLLQGQFSEVHARLTAEMERAAQALQFEKAAALRDRIRAIELLQKRQKVVSTSLADTDVIGYHRGETKSCFVVLHYLDGSLAAKEQELLETPMEQKSEAVSALLRQYYLDLTRTQIPAQILLPCPLDDADALAKLLSETAKHRVCLATPQRGKKWDLVALANKNALQEVERSVEKTERQAKILQLLGGLLHLECLHRIESYDISNQGSRDIVASMVVYVDGKPRKREYRRFKLRGLDHPDDYASMEQVLQRRFQRYRDGDPAFQARPDVLFLDGGAEHAKIARGVVAHWDLAIPVFGMVKDSRHRTRALITPDGQEIGIQQISAVFSFIGQIQEETHRFAITFHRQQQAAHLKASVLDEIPGIGPARKAALWKRFQSLQQIQTASRSDLEATVGKAAGTAVYEYFQKKGESLP